MSRRWLIAGTAVALIAAGSVGIWITYTMRHTLFFPNLTKVQQQDVRTAIEGSLGEALFSAKPAARPVVVQGTGMKALLAPSKELPGPRLIQAYEQDPEKFRRYAKLFETWRNALRLGQIVRQQPGAYQLPVVSSNLKLPPDERLDAWGHPYCISRVGGNVAVVSGGPGTSSFSCTQQRTSPREIAAASRPQFQTSLGEVVFVLEPDASSSSNAKR